MARNSIGTNITPKDLKDLAKEKGVKKILSISAAEYRAIHAKKAGGTVKSIKALTSAEYRELQVQGQVVSSDKKPQFNFVYEVEQIERGYKITLSGRHRSKNELSGKSFKYRLQYKRGIKNAVDIFLLLNRKMIPLYPIQGLAEIDFVFHGPTDRDHDNNGDTIKTLQDTLSRRHAERYGSGISIIEDDSLDYLVSAPHSPSAVRGKVWKVEVFVYEKRGLL